MALCPMAFDNGSGKMVTGTNGSSSVSVTDNSPTELSSMTISEAGTWLIIGCVNWSTSGTGGRQISIQDAINGGREASQTTVGLAGKEVFQQYINVQTISSSTTIKLYGWQNSGGTITCYPALRAIKLSD